MTKRFSLMMALILLSLLQTNNPTFSATDDKPLSKGENLKPVLPYNFSVRMHGNYIVTILYTNCNGIPASDDITAGRTINRCAKENTQVSAKVWGLIKFPPILLHKDNQEQGTESITVPPEGIKMDCGGDRPRNARCDWSTPYKPQ